MYFVIQFLLPYGSYSLKPTHSNLKQVPTLHVGTVRRVKRTDLFNTWKFLVPKTLNHPVQAQVSPYSLLICESLHISITSMFRIYSTLFQLCSWVFSWISISVNPHDSSFWHLLFAFWGRVFGSRSKQT